MIKERDSLLSVSPPSLLFSFSHDDWIFLAPWFPWKQPSGNLTGGADKGTTSSPECETHGRGHRIKGKEEPRTGLCGCVRACVCHVTVFNESVYLYVFFPHCSLFLCSLLPIVFSLSFVDAGCFVFFFPDVLRLYHSDLLWTLNVNDSSCQPHYFYVQKDNRCNRLQFMINIFSFLIVISICVFYLHFKSFFPF